MDGSDTVMASITNEAVDELGMKSGSCLPASSPMRRPTLLELGAYSAWRFVPRHARRKSQPETARRGEALPRHGAFTAAALTCSSNHFGASHLISRLTGSHQ